VAACLLRQITAQRSDLDEQVEKAYDELHPRGQHPGFPLLLQLLKRTCAEYFKTVFIILDALDECETTGVVSMIRELYESKSPIKLFVTSRPYLRSIDGLFPAEETLELRAHQIDLKNVITSKLMEDQTTNPELRDLILEKLLTNANGL
jgi:hypothetical protein